MDAMLVHGNEQFTPEMADFVRSRGPKINEGVLKDIEGKTFHDINKDEFPKLSTADLYDRKAMWVKMYDLANNDQKYRVIYPEGSHGDIVRNKLQRGQEIGDPSSVAWGTGYPDIGKAIKAIELGQYPPDLPEVYMHYLMSERHKVRNFYNNILDPFSPYHDTTIDTHAIAAGTFQPFAGSDTEVSHNFGAAPQSAKYGLRGLYPVYKDAYATAAAERGRLPREMQSITWEAIRGLFPDNWKVKANKDAITGIWQKYRQGLISQEEARRQVYERAGGIDKPDWSGKPASGIVLAQPGS
jgi:hypothetical protein